MQTGKSALMVAADYGQSDCVHLLLEIGADKDARDNVRLFDATLHLLCTFISRHQLCCLFEYQIYANRFETHHYLVITCVDHEYLFLCALS
jgi:ankyrin repeat protein